MAALGILLTFLFTILGGFVFTFGSKASQGFLYLLSYIFFANLLFQGKFLEAVFILFATSLGISALSMIATFLKTVSGAININLFLIDANAFFLTARFSVPIIFQFIVLTPNLLHYGFFHLAFLVHALFLFFFTFTSFFFFRLFPWTGRLIQCCQIYLSDNVYLRHKFRLAQLEYFLFLLFSLFHRF